MASGVAPRNQNAAVNSASPTNGIQNGCNVGTNTAINVNATDKTPTKTAASESSKPNGRQRIGANRHQRARGLVAQKLPTLSPYLIWEWCGSLPAVTPNADVCACYVCACSRNRPRSSFIHSNSGNAMYSCWVLRKRGYGAPIGK
jgi:hypothetical protein